MATLHQEHNRAPISHGNYGQQKRQCSDPGRSHASHGHFLELDNKFRVATRAAGTLVLDHGQVAVHRVERQEPKVIEHRVDIELLAFSKEVVTCSHAHGPTEAITPSNGGLRHDSCFYCIKNHRSDTLGPIVY